MEPIQLVFELEDYMAIYNLDKDMSVSDLIDFMHENM